MVINPQLFVVPTPIGNLGDVTIRARTVNSDRRRYIQKSRSNKKRSSY